MRWQDATQEFDEAFGAAFDLNPTERRCLAVLAEGPKPAKAVAEATGLTAAAVTSLIDRLAARGFVVRDRDEQDRRKVAISLTPSATKVANAFYGPIASEGQALLGVFPETELRIIRDFLEKVLALQERHTRRARGWQQVTAEGLKLSRRG